MPNIFFISDTHFSHSNICKFINYDGSKVRPWDDVQEMDEMLIKNWNNIIRPDDKIYHLGDVCMTKKALDSVMPRLMGKKRLIRGNHDLCSTKDYLKYFDEIYGVRVLDDLVLSHIPLNTECITQRYGVNVHGHLHNNVIKNGLYFNVSVERINYIPIAYEDLKKAIKENQKQFPAEYTKYPKGD